MIKGISSNSPYISTMSSSGKTDIKKVEKSKIESIKEAIRNNTYKIDIVKLAKKIADSL